MKFKLIVFYLALFTFTVKGQVNCEATFIKDTMSLPESGKVLEGEYLETTLKNLSVVKLFKADDGKIYLKLLVTKNFYFNKVGVLEIKSNSKSYYAKNTKQYQVNKTMGMYVIEIFRNYVATLKEDGITSIVFAEAETDFTKHDATQIKKIAKCFYDAISEKK
jgi:hypothetical protein